MGFTPRPSTPRQPSLAAPCAQCIPLAKCPRNKTSSTQAQHFVITVNSGGFSMKRIHKTKPLPACKPDRCTQGGQWVALI